MVVLAIVGVLLAVAIVSMRTDPSVDDVSRSVAGLLREASRKAVAGGPVRADVTAATNLTARTRVRVTTVGTGLQAVVLERLEEGVLPGTADWVELRRKQIPEAIVVAGYSASPELDLGVTPTDFTGDYEVLCEPTGECQGRTLYLNSADDEDKRSRVVVMPLNGSPLVFRGW